MAIRSRRALPARRGVLPARAQPLVTSRAPLGLRGEHELPVPRLRCPIRPAPVDEAPSQYGAVALLWSSLARSRALVPRATPPRG